MTENEFIAGLEGLERALQREVATEFREGVLYPVFRKIDAKLWAAMCLKVAEKSVSVISLVLADFKRAQAAIEKGIGAGTYDDAVKRADRRRNEREASRKEWENMRPMHELAEEQFEKTGNPYYKELAASLKKNREKREREE